MKTIEFVCLANSRKMSGSCIAGKIIQSNKWIRPVSSRENEEISPRDQAYPNGQLPKVLDIIRIAIKYYKPTLFQKENYLIDDKYCWEKKGEFTGSLDELLDHPADLWGTVSSSYHGLYDRFPEDMCSVFGESLYFIKPESMKVIVRTEGEEFGNPKRKVRAEFQYNGVKYIFPVTDPIIEHRYLSGENGIFDISQTKIYLCVSVGLPYNRFCYKFVASLIEAK